jgi:hypothetical protein
MTKRTWGLLSHGDWVWVMTMSEGGRMWRKKRVGYSHDLEII